MSSTTDPGNRSAAEIEREVEQTRASLTDTPGRSGSLCETIFGD